MNTIVLNVVTFYSEYNTMLSIVTIGCDLCSDGIIISVCKMLTLKTTIKKDFTIFTSRIFYNPVNTSLADEGPSW